MDTTRKIVEGMMDAIASAEYPTEINETLLLLLTALEGARRQLSALTAERDTLKALCVELVDALDRAAMVLSISDTIRHVSPEFPALDAARELLTRARSILK